MDAKIKTCLGQIALGCSSIALTTVPKFEAGLIKHSHLDESARANARFVSKRVREALREAVRERECVCV